MANISLRESIRWLPEEATEPTSTIVLTSPGKRFVDIRLLKHPDKEAQNATEDNVALSRLDWAIAGTSWSEPTSDPSTSHSTWTHWIDSKTLNPESATDDGLMTPLDENRTLEKGRMVNPATGVETDYEEIWVDPQPTAVPGEDATRQVVVLKWENVEGKERGLVVRIGKLCQGFMRSTLEEETDGKGIRCERWEWRVAGDGSSGGWKTVKRVGDGTRVPCKALLLEGWKGAQGSSLVYDGRAWEALEVSGLDG